MTDDSTTHDSIDTQTTPRDDRPGARTDQQDDSPNGLGRRAFLQGAAAVAGGGALAALGDPASAADTGKKRLLVVGEGPGHHTYEIEMKHDGSIEPGRYANPNGSPPDSEPPGEERMEGHVWNWNVDSYRYTGRIDRVIADGEVSFVFPDGAFPADEANGNLLLYGRSDSHHWYAIGTNSGNIELGDDAEKPGDADRGTWRSEQNGTPDLVTGNIQGEYSGGATSIDDFDIANGAVNHIEVDGHVEFYRAPVV